MAKTTSIIWINEFEVRASLHKKLGNVDNSAKAAIHEYLSAVEETMKKYLWYGHGVKSGTMRGSIHHNKPISLGHGIVQGKTFTNVNIRLM